MKLDCCFGIMGGLLLLSLGLGGCAALRPQGPGAPEPWVQAGATRPSSDVEALLLYFEYIKKLGSAEVNREHEMARQAFAKNKTDFARLQLAMLWSLPNAGFRDDTRALGMLDPLLKDGGSRNLGLKSFAFFMSSMITEQKRLEEGTQSLSQKLKDEQKAVEALQQKLEALKNIEKSIIERQQKQSTPGK